MSTSIPVAFSIKDSHIANMIESFDSGMCDPSRANAVCRALQSHVVEPEELRVHFRQGALCASHRGEWVELPETLASWLQGAFRGLARNAGNFHAFLPAHWLLKTVECSSATRLSSTKTNSLRKESAAA